MQACVHKNGCNDAVNVKGITWLYMLQQASKITKKVLICLFPLLRPWDPGSGDWATTPHIYDFK